MGCQNTKIENSIQLKLKYKLFEHSGIQEFRQNYKFLALLGQGGFGKVFLCENKVDPDFRVAVKIIDKSKYSDNSNSLNSLKQEIRILSKVDHVNIARHYETYEDKNYIYIVMEYCDGGELFDEIINRENQTFNESEVASIMDKLLRAINHCHAQGIIHRDIKPENILIKKKDGEIKLVDFGLSKRKFMSQQDYNETLVGTPFYMAPEVFLYKYTEKCDIWSLGVIMYVLLSGYLPFQGQNKNDVYSKIKEGKYHFRHVEFQSVSQEAKDLIQRMLDLDDETRISAEEALRDPWLQKFNVIEKGSQEDQLDPFILNQLRKFKGETQFKKVCLSMLVSMLTQKNQISKSLEQSFKKLDLDHTGLINRKELQLAFQSANTEIKEEEIENMIREIDFHKINKISYSEFLSATIPMKQIVKNDHKKIRAVYQQFDCDNSGRITAEDIVEGMHKCGHDVSVQELKKIMKKHDSNKDGFISFEEFKDMLLE